MQRRRGKEKKLERTEGAGRFLLTMGQKRSFLNSSAGLGSFRGTSLFFYKQSVSVCFLCRIESFDVQ